WNLAAKDDKPLAVFPQVLPVTGVALSPNGQRVAVGNVEGASGVVRILDVALGREVQIFDHAGPVPALQFLGDNRTLVTVRADKTARLLDVDVLTAFEAHKGGVVSAQFNNTGTQALTAGKDNTVKLWDLTKNAVVKTFGPFPEPVRAAVYSR